jgi:hypothetical protein
MIEFGPSADAVPSLPAFAARLAEALRRGAEDLPFGVLATELFRLQFAANPAYRRFCQAGGGSPESVRDAGWESIPAIPVVAFKELELTSLAPAARTAVFHSSGTTGQVPSRHFHGPDSLALYEASLVAGFARAAVPRDSVPRRFVALTPPPDLVPHSSLAHMFAVCARRFGTPDSVFVGRPAAGGAWDLDLPWLLAVLGESRESGTPVFLLGTAFHFVHLVDFCAERNLRFRIGDGSRVLETGGYKGRSRVLSRIELHAAIAGCLGLPSTAIVREYGMSELSSQAYAVDGEGGRAGAFRFPPWARVRVISPESGREMAEGGTGLLRVFDLANVWSVMAVQTEDLAVRRGEGFELVGRAPRAEPRGCSLLSAA